MIDYILKELEEKAEYLGSTVAAGKCSDWSDYRFLCGQIRGLIYCKEVIEDAIKKAQEEEDKGE